MKLNAVKVETIKVSDKRQEIPDALCVGLYLVVQPTGRKSWQIRYRASGVHRRMALGPYPQISLAEARDKARDAQRKTFEGGDPVAEAKAVLEAAQAEALSDRDRIKTLVADFDKRHLKGLKSGAQALQFLERFVVAEWGNRKVQTITKRDVIDLLDKIVDSGRETTANRVLAHARKFFNWCRERDVLQLVPTDGVKAPAKEVSRERVLSDQEVIWFWRACDTVGEPWGPLGKLLLLTGQRLNEAAQITDGEIRGDLWHLSSDRTKNARAHDVPLSNAAQAILRGKARVPGKPGYIFTTTGTTPMSGFSRGRDGIARAMEVLANEGLPDGADPVEIPHWGFHDLRRTAATGMARLGIPVRVTEAVLNHVSGTSAGIVSVYQRHDYASEKRAALEAWGRLVVELVEGKADNVVRLEARA